MKVLDVHHIYIVSRANIPPAHWSFSLLHSACEESCEVVKKSRSCEESEKFYYLWQNEDVVSCKTVSCSTVM